MRVYKFLPAKWALDDLERQRLKITRDDELNDPFELDVFDLSDPDFKRTWTETKKKFLLTEGFGCFSRNWKNPVLWGHYADKHRGICLGFDVRDDPLMEVSYTENRLVLNAANFPALPEEKKQELMYTALRTKYIDWRYEEEVRGYATLEERDESGHFFSDFDDNMKLTEVIRGALCAEDDWKKIEEVIKRDYAGTVQFIKARLSDNSFEVVEDEHGFGEAR